MPHREDRPWGVWHGSRRATARRVAARDVERAQRPSARPNVDAGASVEASPAGFESLNPRRQSIVPPVVDLEAPPEVPDDTTIPRLAMSKRGLDAVSRLTQRNACDRMAQDDQPALRVR